MKVLFLDFKGVLDTFYDRDKLSYDNLQVLKYIVNSTGSKVVITDECKNSFYYTGRYSKDYEYLVNTLISYGIDVIDKTNHGESKELEISDYIKLHEDIENYCVISSNIKVDKGSKHVFKVPALTADYPFGIRHVDVNEICNILGRLPKDKNTLKKTSI